MCILIKRKENALKAHLMGGTFLNVQRSRTRLVSSPTTYKSGFSRTPDLTTQQKSHFDKGHVPQGFECDHIVCAKSQRLLCTHQTPPNSLTSGAHGACFCAGCLNSPLFSLLILAAAACEAWIDDNESKRLTWAPVSLLWVTPTRSQGQSETLQWRFKPFFIVYQVVLNKKKVRCIIA